jgi:hypothetical protein
MDLDKASAWSDSQDGRFDIRVQPLASFLRYEAMN